MPRRPIATTLWAAALAAVPVGALHAQSVLLVEEIAFEYVLETYIEALEFDFGGILETTGNWYPIVPNGNLAGGVMGLGYRIAFEEPVLVDGFTANPQWFADALWAYDDPSNASACFSDYLLSIALQGDVNNPWLFGYWTPCSPPLGEGALQLFVAENVVITTIEPNVFRLEADLFVSEEFGAAMLAADWTLDNIGGDLAGTYRIDITTVPAPGAVAILGLAGLAGSRRRRD